MSVSKTQVQRPATRWAVRPAAPPEVVATLSKQLSVPPLLASILWARGFNERAQDELNPPLALTQIPDLHKAAERLELALRTKKRILIHGDYDADGISGTAVLTLGLRALGGNVLPFIPNRLTDGYGISPERVEEHANTADVFLTVDCGISNLDEIAYLQKAGVEVIVSDHHTPGQALPDCLIVHPKMSPLAQQGLPELTGAGVAYHILWALHERLGLEAPLEYSDIASIGIIADVAPLMGENRALIKEGLARMYTSRWPGLKAAVTQSKLRDPITAQDVAFIIAPRLNAAGRLGEADLGLELFITASERRARELASYLDARNADRRDIQDAMFEDALLKVDTSAPALVLDSNEWHPGVMGIVASKLLERFYKPVFIIAKGKGSVRSTPGISAVKALRHAADTLKRYGGHSQAAGFAIADACIPAFREAICEFVSQFPAPEPRVVADALLSSADITDDLYNAMNALEPFGEGHPSPQFALTDTLDMARAVGKNKNTLQVRIAGVKGVAWQKGELANNFKTGSTVNAMISLRENFWQNKRSLEFIADEIKPASPLSLDQLTNTPAPINVQRGQPADPARCLTLQERDVPASLENKPLWIRCLPLHEHTPLNLTAPLRSVLSTSNHVHFDLPEQELNALESLLLVFPSLQDVRAGFVCLSRGKPLPFAENKNQLVTRCLQELELLDAAGRPLRGQKRDPYESDTLLSGLVERYVLSSFLKAYRHLDDASFALTVTQLFLSNVATRVPDGVLKAS